MFGLNMFLEITLIFGFIITQIARKFDAFMLRLNVFLKTNLLAFLVIALIPRIFDI